MNEVINKKPKVIFMDIDGPLINGRLFSLDAMVSIERTYFNTESLALLTRMIRLTGAKLVMNTAHNNHEIPVYLSDRKRNIKDDLVDWGISEPYFHDEWKTEYPNTNYMPDRNGKHPRLFAVERWLERNGDHDWVAFDDDLFHDKRQVFIDYELGMNYAAYRKGMKLFGYRKEPKRIMLA